MDTVEVRGKLLQEQRKLEVALGVGADGCRQASARRSEGGDLGLQIGHLGLANTRLLLVRQAIRRIDLARYGICLSCQEPIPTERLMGVPEACFCVGCQTELEKKEKIQPGIIMQIVREALLPV